MKKKIELDDVEVIFDPTPLTEEEKRSISEYIRKDKAKRKKKAAVHNAKHLHVSR
ncbi:MAG TPA: hypothetical protein VNB90_17370 [Cytophagaceae bacterium]|jgi:hypothetical protein|nr:hypothetical protein [Cytophagaceae bacterium]